MTTNADQSVHTAMKLARFHLTGSVEPEHLMIGLWVQSRSSAKRALDLVRAPRRMDLLLLTGSLKPTSFRAAEEPLFSELFTRLLDQSADIAHDYGSTEIHSAFLLAAFVHPGFYRCTQVQDILVKLRVDNAEIRHAVLQSVAAGVK